MDRNKNVPVVLLTEVEGERTLPIWVGATRWLLTYPVLTDGNDW